jgi:mRNA interferase YafQ
MKELFFTTQFKKDLKRFRNSPEKIAALEEALKILKKTGTLPDKYLPHKLYGIYKGCFECHIENDFLLIWFDTEKEVIELIRIGSHSELF